MSGGAKGTLALAKAVGTGAGWLTRVGVAPWTLALWLRTPSSATIRAIDVVPDGPAAGTPVPVSHVLITPQGLRVEGLDRDTLVAVLRALG